MIVERSSHVVIASPSMERTTSPFFKPACSAGRPGLISPIFEEGGRGIPVKILMREKITTARKKLKKEPEPRIRARFHIGATEKERRRSSSFTSSSGFSPTSLTNPPRGKTEIWNWVSPNFLPISFGPHPNEKVSTPMHNFLATPSGRELGFL